MCPHKKVEQSKGHHIVIPCQVGKTFVPGKVFIPQVIMTHTKSSSSRTVFLLSNIGDPAVEQWDCVVSHCWALGSQCRTSGIIDIPQISQDLKFICKGSKKHTELCQNYTSPMKPRPSSYEHGHEYYKYAQHTIEFSTKLAGEARGGLSLIQEIIKAMS